MTATAVLLGAVSTALVFLLRTPPQTAEHLTSSNSAFRTNSIFSDDIESASPIAGQLPVARNAPGCGGDDHSVVRVLTALRSGVEVRSYSVVPSGRLERRVCRGVDLTAALAQLTPSVRTVVPNLAKGTTPAVSCRATSVAALAPSTPDGDLQCRLVKMTVTTSSHLTFTVDGRRDTVQSPLASPAPTKQSCTLVSSADTYVDSFPGHGNRRDGDNDHFNVQFKNGGVRLNAYIKVDLLSGCIGTGEPASLPGGKQLQSATLRLTELRRDNNPGGDDLFRLTTLPSWYKWNEDTLTYNMLEGCNTVPTAGDPNPLGFPCDYQDGATPPGDPDLFYNFHVGLTGALPQVVNVPVLGAVQSWYDGSAENRGWTLDRGHADWRWGNDHDEQGGWQFASREHETEAFRPTLVLEWK